jgi:hypothetical protein
MPATDLEIELRWVQTQIKAFIFSRTNGMPARPRDLARYEALCRREVAIMKEQGLAA